MKRYVYINKNIDLQVVHLRNHLSIIKIKYKRDKKKKRDRSRSSSSGIRYIYFFKIATKEEEIIKENQIILKIKSLLRKMLIFIFILIGC